MIEAMLIGFVGLVVFAVVKLISHCKNTTLTRED
jgi:hypothetical protein